MSHSDGHPARAVIDAATASEIAETMKALSNPGRVRILARLRDGECHVGELALAADLSPSATSHQLRLLRHLGWVVRRRRGLMMAYALHDAHVEEMLDQAAFHLEHIRLAAQDIAAAS